MLRGSNVECSACSRSFRRFDPHRGRANAICPGCGALERHRLLWAFVGKRMDLATVTSALHFAPERQIQDRLRHALDGRYVAVDLKPVFDAALNITALPFPEDSFDLILCCHVLEHIPDDAAAMREIARVLAPGGHALVQVPQDMAMAVSDEGPDLPPDERSRRFGQADHVRIYGGDLIDRLQKAGLCVTEVLAPSLGAGLERWAIPDDQALYDCTKS